MTSDNRQVFHECGPGWKTLIAPLIFLADKEGATVAQIKEKFGELRFYVDGGSDVLEDMINQATEDSKRTCEMCGQDGHLMIKGGWLKTVCAEHALELGYKTRA